MKKSIQLLFLLTVVFILSDRVIFFGLQKLDQQVFAGQSVGKANHFFKIKDSVDLLVFGSSRANRHVVNKVLDSSSFNMGVDGTNLGYCTALISTLERRKQTILVHIDPDKLYSLKYHGEDILNLINHFKREDKIAILINSYFPEEYYISNVFNSFAYNGLVLGVLKNYVAPKYDYTEYDGYDGLFPSKEQKKIFNKLVKTSSNLDFKNTFFVDNENFDVNATVDEFVERIINVCEKNNSKLIFFTSPNLYTIPAKATLKTKDYFEKKGIPYFDYSGFFSEFNPEHWKDFTHLSNKGAILFTNELNKRIVCN